MSSAHRGTLASRISALFDRLPLLLIFLAFGFTVLVVDPLRETPMEDDWAYSWTVWNLLETGRYELHAWLSANMPFQAFWGAGAALLAGFSFSALRVSTLVLSGLGLAAFYLLAREHGLGRKAACLLTLVLWASPLYLRFSFNFMTDVPFVSLFVLTLLLYTRAIGRDSHALMIAGSLAATACILTRQFGVALIAGLAVTWLLRDRRWQRAPFYLVGVVAPALATLWQVYMGLFLPNWAARYSVHLQKEYLSDLDNVLVSFAGRFSVVVQYMALFCLPLLPAAGSALWDAWRGAAREASLRREALLLGAASVFLLGGFLCHALVTGRTLMPLLPWNFDGLVQLGTAAQLAATLVAASGGILFARIFLLRYLPAGWRSVTPAERLLDFATLFSLGMTLVFLQIGDEYLLVYLPFTLIVVGRRLEPTLERAAPWLLAGTTVLLLAGALWTRSLLIPEERIWALADEVHQRGVPAEQIWGDWMWVSYHHFDDYASHVDPTRIENLEQSFGNWLWRRFDAAEYAVLLGPEKLEQARRQIRRRRDRMEIVAEQRFTRLPGASPETVYLVRRIEQPLR